MGNTSVQLPSDFAILNFTINPGDKVRWMNDDSYDFPFTLVQEHIHFLLKNSQRSKPRELL